MKDFAFKVNLVAVVRVQAENESAAREVVPAVLGAPSAAEIGLANQNIVGVTGHDATVTSVNFSIGQIKASKSLEKRAKLVALAKSWRRAE
jgi:hypothetical protein